MFINENTVAIIFKLINFITLIGLVFFLFKKYFKADLFLLIAQKEAAHKALLIEQNNLEQQQQNLDLLLKQEAQQCHDLKAKIDEWRSSVSIKKNKEEQEYRNLLTAAKKRNTEIILKNETRRIQNDIIDTVVADIETSLTNTFKSATKSNDYLNTIIDFMNKREYHEGTN